MIRSHWQRALRVTQLSAFEGSSSLAGVLLTVAGAVAAVAASEAGGLPRAVGLAGLGAIALCAASRGVRLYRAGVSASLPTSVGKLKVRVRPARGFGVLTMALAVALPLAVAVAVLVLVEWAWLLVAGVVLLGCGALIATWARDAGSRRPYEMSSAAASACLQRLGMRAAMPVPEVVVEHAAVANAWTAKGRIHVTSSVLEMLDDSELEAVLAHELAHLARTPCSASSARGARGSAGC